MSPVRELSHDRLSSFGNRLKQLVYTPEVVLGWLFLILFAYLIVVPLVYIAVSSFQVQDGDARRIGEVAGSWTGFYWSQALTGRLGQRFFWEPLRNTLFVSFTYTALSMTIGVTMAWLLVKTNVRLRKFIGSIAIIPYILPSWTLALAWITFFGNDRVGIGAPGVLQNILRIAPPDWLAYGPFPIIIVLAVNYSAYSFLLASAAFATIDSRMEEAALLHGSSQWLVLRSVTLPVILPALGSAFILTFAKGLGTFGVPAFLGIPVRYFVLATSLFQSTAMGRFGDAFALTIVLVALAAITIGLNNRVLGKRRQFTTMSGKGSSFSRIELGKFRGPVSFALIAFTVITAFVPIVLLVWQSFQLRLGDYSLSNLTTAYWVGEVYGIQGILVSSRVQAAAWNTLRIGLSVAVVTAAIGVVIGYVVVKRRGTVVSRLLEQVTFIPYVVPGIAFAAIYLTMFAQPVGPIPALYGTVWLIALAFMINRLPFSTRSGIAAMVQIGRSLEEAAELHGAGFTTRLSRILFPLSKRGFLTGFILSFVSIVKDLSLVILLVTPQTMLLTPLTFGYVDLGQRQFADAIGVIIVVIVLGCTFSVQWLTKTNPLSGFGGNGQ